VIIIIVILDLVTSRASITSQLVRNADPHFTPRSPESATLGLETTQESMLMALQVIFMDSEV
jgi:hypothetical protein